MTIRELAASAGISRSSCHAIVVTLVAEGLLEPIPGGGYQLGQALAPLGGMVLERTGLVERATPRMEELSLRLGGEIHLAYSHGEQLIYLVRVRRDRRVHMPNRYGEPLPLHRTGAGWAVLLATPRTRLPSILSGLPRSERDHILNALEVGRERGFVLYSGKKLDVWAVAAPIRMTPSVTAAIAVAQPGNLMNDQRIAESGALVVRVCRALEHAHRRGPHTQSAW